MVCGFLGTISNPRTSTIEVLELYETLQTQASV